MNRRNVVSHVRSCAGKRGLPLELLFLGTGAGVPAKRRNVSAAALIMPERGGETWLFDCGEATQHQILHTHVKLAKITKIFITHLHGDHIFGLPGLLGTRSFQADGERLDIYGPPGIRAFIEQTLHLSGTHLTYPLSVTEIDEGVILEDEALVVEARRLEHVLLSFGFRVMEKDKPGPLLAEKIQSELGLPPGPIYKRFKEQETVTLPDGRTVRSADYIGPPKRGKIVAMLGDTRPCSGAAALAAAATVLVHEATFTVDKEASANQYGHSSARQAASTAKEAGVQALILTHISSRYRESEALLAEAQAVFPNTYVAEDLWSYVI